MRSGRRDILRSVFIGAIRDQASTRPRQRVDPSGLLSPSAHSDGTDSIGVI
jgi:hypothetical protein